MNELFIAKLHANGFDHGFLYFMYSYISRRKQMATVNSSHTDFVEIIFGVPQVSILRPLLFDIYGVYDLFFENIDLDVASYADDTTPYSCATDLSTIFKIIIRKV